MTDIKENIEKKQSLIRVVILCMWITFSFTVDAQNKVDEMFEIPIGENGISAQLDEFGDYFIDGFAFKDGKYYFSCKGQIIRLTLFNDSSKVLSKALDLRLGKLHIYQNILYSFDLVSNTLYQLDLNSLSITDRRSYGNERIIDVFFIDSLTVFKIRDRDSPTLGFKYIAHNLQTGELEELPNKYNLSTKLFNCVTEEFESEFLGRFSDFFVFVDYEIFNQNDSYELIYTVKVRDLNCNILTASERIYSSKIGTPLQTNRSQLVRLSGNEVCILGVKNDAINITKLSLLENLK